MKIMGLYGVSALAISIATTGAAAAQDTALEEVIVTANKREQTLQEVPISVAVVSGAKIQKEGIVQFNDLQSSVPNLQIDQTNGNFAITIRGLGAGPGNLAFEQSVGLFVDGVYLSRARSFQTPLLDAARVEVVRGPQGALFGKNTNAGAISIVTRGPTRTFEAQGRVAAEVEHGGWNAEGAVSGPISDVLAARLTVRAGYIGPYIDNDLSGDEEYSTRHRAVRGQLLFTPNEAFTARLKAEYATIRSNGGNTMYNYIGDRSCALCNAARASTGAVPAQEWPGFRRTSRNPDPEFDRTRAGIASLNMEWNAAGWKFTSISALQSLSSDNNLDLDGGGLTFLQSGLGEDSHSLSQEFRGEKTFANGVLLTGGLSYIDTTLKTYQDTDYRAASVPIALPFNGVSTRVFHQDGKSLSPFAAVEVPVGQLTFSATARYSHETKDADVLHVVRGVFPAAFRPYDLSGKRKENLWDYSARAHYEFSPAASFYVSYATGTKGGGFVANDSQLLTNILSGAASFQYEDEKARSLEAGGKFRFLDGRGALNVAVFHTKFDNLQVSQFNGTAFVTGNAAKATSQGVEVDTDVRLSRHLTVGGNLGYLDATYDDYPGGQCLYNAPPTCVPRTNNLAGARLTRAPKWKGELYAEGNVEIVDGWSLSGRLAADYVTRSYFQPDLNPLHSQKPVTKWNGRIGLAPVGGRWELAVIGRNLTNEKTITQAFATPNFGGNSHMALIGQPRTVSLEISARY